MIDIFPPWMDRNIDSQSLQIGGSNQTPDRGMINSLFCNYDDKRGRHRFSRGCEPKTLRALHYRRQGFKANLEYCQGSGELWQSLKVAQRR